MVGDNLGFFGPNEDVLRAHSRFGCWTGCMAGCLVVGIEANGNVKGCLSQQDPAFIEGNLRQTTLHAIWNRPGGFAYNRRFAVEQLEGFCRECTYADICRGGCTCAAHFASGSRFDNPYCAHRVARLQDRGVSEELHPRHAVATRPWRTKPSTAESRPRISWPLIPGLS